MIIRENKLTMNEKIMKSQQKNRNSTTKGGTCSIAKVRILIEV